MSPIQILLIIFFVFAVIRVVGRAHAKELSLFATLGWVLFWIIASAVVLVPDSTFYFARLLGVGQGADLVVYLALVVIFFLLFRLLVRLTKIERALTKIVRHDALEDKDNI